MAFVARMEDTRLLKCLVGRTLDGCGFRVRGGEKGAGKGVDGGGLLLDVLGTSVI